MTNIIAALDAERIEREIPDIGPGDTVVVEVKVKEGDRERVQAYEGVVIARRNRGLNSSFTVRKISHGEGVERVFQTYSPSLGSITVKRRGNVRRAKLYYFPATKLSLDIAGMDLATNMALMGCIGAITGLTTMAGLEQAVKDRFLGKGFVVSGGTAALDSVVERKFKKKQELIEKNVAVMRAGWNYAVDHGWAAPEVKRAEEPVATTASA